MILTFWCTNKACTIDLFLKKKQFYALWNRNFFPLFISKKEKTCQNNNQMSQTVFFDGCPTSLLGAGFFRGKGRNICLHAVETGADCCYACCHNPHHVCLDGYDAKKGRKKNADSRLLLIPAWTFQTWCCCCSKGRSWFLFLLSRRIFFPFTQHEPSYSLPQENTGLMKHFVKRNRSKFIANSFFSSKKWKQNFNFPIPPTPTHLLGSISPIFFLQFLHQ